MFSVERFRFRWRRLYLGIGSLSKHVVVDSENIVWKCNYAFLQSFLNDLKSLRLQNVYFNTHIVKTNPELNWNPRFRGN